MAIGRLILLPALLAVPPARIAIGLAFGTPAFANMLDESLLDWLYTAAWFGGLIAIGHITSVLPAAQYLSERRVNSLVSVMPLGVVIVGGAAILIVLMLPAIFAGGSLSNVLLLSLLGSTVGVVALIVWLPLNLDMLKRPASA